MRADRLVAVLLLLQTRGRVTAPEVAAELEVSERTARRDLEALGIAGLPVYSTQGRGGGWFLAGGGRTDLSGLTAAEARALFLVAGPSTEVDPAVKSALRKLVSALPPTMRSAAQKAATSVIVDPTGWDGTRPRRPQPALLGEVTEAVAEARELRLSYTDRAGSATERIIQPLGLAAKGDVWYLVAGTEAGVRTFRVDRMSSVSPTGRPAEPPVGFDLAEAWSLISESVDQRRAPVVAQVVAVPRAAGWCRAMLGTRAKVGPPGPDGRVTLALRGHSIESLACELAGFGSWVEVTEPDSLRRQLARLAGELSALYGTDRPAPDGASSGLVGEPAGPGHG
ncbi:MAG: helix-turn-helix transcriptional regulator [Acidimicrobiales bacterium]